MSQQVLSLLEQLQQAMQRAGHWQTVAPAVEKLMSNEPFSIDTLSFLEWLQWIYIARLRALLDAGRPLPSGAQVQPYAEEALKASRISVPGLLELIAQLDRALS